MNRQLGSRAGALLRLAIFVPLLLYVGIKMIMWGNVRLGVLLILVVSGMAVVALRRS